MNDLVSFYVDKKTATAIDQFRAEMAADLGLEVPRAVVAEAALRNWLVDLGYLVEGDETDTEARRL